MQTNPIKYCCTLIFLLFQTGLYSQQEIARFPIRFTQYYNCPTLNNPAFAGAYHDYEFAIGNKQLLGNYNQISTYYFNANMKVARKYSYSGMPFSSLGVLLYNDREGKYLNRSRFYATYSWHGKLTSSVNFSGGFHLGGMNYSVQGTDESYKVTQAISGGSDIAPDGMIGLNIYNDKFNAGIAYCQMFKSSIQPIDEVAVLKPFFNLTGSCIIFNGLQLTIEPCFAFRATPGHTPWLIDATVLATYNNTMRFIVGVHNNSLMVNSFEFRNILLEIDGLNLSFTYSYPLIRTGLVANSIEVGLSLNLNRQNSN